MERGTVLEELQTIRADVKRVSDGLLSVLRLGFTGASPYGIMPRAVREAARTFEGIALSVSGKILTPQLVTELLKRRIDVAVLRPHVASPDIAYRVVAQERLITPLPLNSRFWDRDELTMNDFSSHTLVGYPENSTPSQTLANRVT